MSSAPRIDLEAVRRWAAGLVNYLFAIAGGIVSVVTIIVMLESKGSRLWVKNHPFLLLVLLVAAVVTILVLLNVIQKFIGTIGTLRALLPTENPHPSEHDKLLARDALARMLPASPLVNWLKLEFNAAAAPQDRVQEFAEAARRLSRAHLDFDDTKLAQEYLQLQRTTETLSQKIQQWMSLEAGETQRIIPVEWKFEENGKYRLALTEINAAHDELVRAYDRCLRVSQEQGLSIG